MEKMSKSPVIGEIEERDGKQVWIIKPFNSIETNLGEGQILFYSPVFTTPTPLSYSARLSWQIKMYPNIQKSGRSILSFYLCSRNQDEVKAFVSLYILNDKGEELYKRCLRNAHTFNMMTSWGFSQFISRNTLLNSNKCMLIDDTLRISWNITFVSTPNQDNNDNSIQMDHFKSVFNNGNFSDVTFVIGEHKLQLHKVILTGLSPVFQAMFEHDMKEKKESLVNITDISYNIMKELLRYIYHRQVNDIKKNACDLLVAAEKYSVTGLKTLCEQTLNGSLNLDNAIGNLKLAMTYNAMSLKSTVTDFITSRLKDFVDREDFKQLESNYKDELFRAIARKKISN